MKTKIITLLLVLSCSYVFSQEYNNDCVRFIEVTGSSEMEVEPDEIRFEIGIQEYWKEEFEKGKEDKDFVTKIPIEKIEKEFMDELERIGVSKDQIIINEVGSYMRSHGKNFLKSKTIEIVITDFAQINEIILNVKTRGVNNMRIAELKNKDITNYRKQVKIEAMKAAKEKATYLLESVGDSLGQVISVIEINSGSNFFQKPQDITSNTIIPSASNNSENSNMKMIKLKYEIKVRFKIK